MKNSHVYTVIVHTDEFDVENPEEVLEEALSDYGLQCTVIEVK